MSAIWIKQFGGVDVRRLPEATAAGSLIKGTDGHITRGGEFEKRAAFVPTYTLPSHTVNLAADSSSIYVFGNAASPAGLPAGVSYLRIQDPSDISLSNVVSWDLFKGTIYAVGNFDGVLEHFYGTSSVVTRNPLAASCVFAVTSGLAGATIDIQVDGVSATGGPVAWAGSPTATATALAAAINSTTSSPDYVATALISVMTLSAAITGTAANGRTVAAIITGTAATTLPTTLTGGDTGYLSGTRYVRTIDLKMYTLSQTDLQFSSLESPLDWDGSLGGTGFGFIDTSQYTAASEDLTAVVEFVGQAAVFSQLCIQLWTLDADPANNAIGQRLKNTGTSCPRSLTQFGDSDMFYLAENGLRSLQATPMLNANVPAPATTYAAGSPIDPLIVAKLRSLTETQRASVIGLIEPNSGNFWLIMLDTIFVYAYFPDEGISAWTVYNPGFTVSDACVFNRRVYVRSGNTIYVYGGLATGQDTDATVAEAWSAYLNDGDPAMTKTWRSFDAAVTGEWALSVGMNLSDTSVEDEVAVIAHTTYNDESIGGIGASTHISLRFRSQGSGPAVLGAFALHYDPETEDDDT